MAKARKKGTSGAATNYIPRTQALRKLQLKLPDFRRLCILKGIYPREPRSRKRVSGGNSAPKTYYWIKDITFLAHEPLLQKFRDYKVFARKLRKALGKRQVSVARHLEANRPAYTLDHLIKERYPSFVDAVRDLDDALCMLFLFARMPQTDKLSADTSRRCARLCAEFQHYVIATQALRKVFLSVKGVYYQADVIGQSVTWIVPYPFAQTVPSDVDYRIMLTFLEFYETLVGFVNYKLYSDENLAYPPTLDAAKDSGAAGLAAFTLQPKGALHPLAVDGTLETAAMASAEAEPAAAGGKQGSKAAKERLRSLPAKIAQLAQQQSTHSADDTPATTAPQDDEDELDEFPPNEAMDEDALPTASHSHLGRLFAGCTFFIGREVPRSLIEFVILACGGRVGWEDGLGSPFAVDSAAITHQIVDRPAVAATVPGRDYVQPQWVFDCVNAQRLLSTHLYVPGATLPPHLSPFERTQDDSYVPPEAHTLFQPETLASGGLLAAQQAVAPEAGAEPDAHEDVEEDAEDQAEDADEAHESDEEARHQDELAAEAAGIPYSQYKAQQKAAGATAPVKKRVRKPMTEEQEERQLAKSMMRQKDRRLLRKIEATQSRRQSEAELLAAKRKAIDGASAPAKAGKATAAGAGKAKAT